MKNFLWIVIAIIAAVAMLFVGSWFIAGSLEEFPTPEQIEAGRIAYGLMLVPLVGIEILALSRIFRKR